MVYATVATAAPDDLELRHTVRLERAGNCPEKRWEIVVG